MDKNKNIYKNLIFLDTETTGLDFKDNGKDRLIEIAAIQISSVPDEKMPYFHTFCNPDGVKVDETAYQTHHISNEQLKDAPKFEQIVESFLDFIKDKILVAHNMNFDLRVINKELKRINLPPINNKYIDTLKLSKSLFPNDNRGNKLDDLCDRFNIDRSQREKQGHNALLDTTLLAKSYIAMVAIQEYKKKMDSLNPKM